MLLWLIIALMTAAALGAVLWPLLRRRGAIRSGSDVAVYRDQLEGIGRDQTLGLIPASEAEAARVEISRRLLAAADRAKQSAASAAPLMRSHRVAAVAILLLLPLGAGGFYLWLGSPDIAAAPIASRQKAVAEQRAVENMVVQVETYLQRNPNDGRGWEVLAPVYMRLGRYDESVMAWRNAIQYLGETAERQANLGESLTASADGLVTAEAKTAFDRAVQLDPTLVSARYYQGLAAEQDGRRDEAAKIWRELIAAAPAGAHWVDSIREALVRVEGKPGAAPSATAQAPAPAAPSAGSAPKSAEAQGGGDQIRGMVERLAERLKKDGSDPDGWVMLVRSYKVIGQTENMQGAIANARRALAGDADKLQRFEAGLKDVESGAPPAAVPTPGSPPSSAANPEPTPGASADAGRGPSASEAAARAPAPTAPTADSVPKSAEAAQGGGDPIGGMVDRLAERLKKDGSDPDRWVMLVRSYKVLEQSEKMQGAIADARRALASDADKLQRFEAGLKDVESGPPPATAAPAPGSPPSSAASPEGTPGASPGAGRGPSASDMAAAEAMTPEQRDARIRGMVGALAERLKKEGSDLDGWMRLVRSYVVLGDTDKARAAVADARRALGADAQKLRQLDDFVKGLGIEG